VARTTLQWVVAKDRRLSGVPGEAGLRGRACEALFSTVTNVNFDPLRLEQILIHAATVRDQAQTLYLTACKKR
jgi:hydroxylamine reductase (hybrid-cluster protein)